MKDYSRKPYRTNKSYPEMIRYTPARSFWNSITERESVFSEYGNRGRKLTAIDRRYLQFLKQSEAKKPYLADDYEEMEEVFEGFPGLIDDNPHIDHPWMPDPQPIQVPLDPELFILFAFTEDFYCLGATSIIQVNGTHPIYDIRFRWPNLMDPGTTFTILSGLGTPTVIMSLTVPVSGSPLIRMEAYEEAFNAPPLPSSQGRGWTDFTVSEQRDIAECPVFTFDLDMADGNVADGTQDIKFTVRDSTGATIPSLATYDDDIDKWVLQIEDDPIDTNGYWVSYYNDSINTTAAIKVTTLYPFKYKTADFTNAANRIAPGDYTDSIHVIKWDTSVTNEPDIDTGIDACDTDLGTDWTTSTAITGGVTIRTTEDQRFYVNVKASAEYKTEWEFDDFSPTPLYCQSYFLTPVGENCDDFGQPTASCPDPISTFYVDLGHLCITYTGGEANNTSLDFTVTFTSISGTNVETKTETSPASCSSAFLEYPSWGASTFSEDQTSPLISGIDEGYELVFEPVLQVEGICCDTGNASPEYIERLEDLAYSRYNFHIGSLRTRNPSFDIEILLT